MSIAVEESQKLINETTMANFHHSDNQLSFWEFLLMNQGAYVAGRTAEPTEAEIEAAAIVAVNTLHGFYPDSMPCWEDSSEDTQSRAKQYAAYMLEAARKAVTA